MKFTTNIGLNNNPFDEKNQVLAIFDKLIELSGGTIDKTQFKVGEYDGAPEPTLIIDFNIGTNHLAYEIINFATIIFNQECIPILSKDKTYKKLIYNYKFNGEKLNFDENYFLSID